MKKYYTMPDCFNECGDEDIPFIENGYNCFLMGSKKKIMKTPVRFSIYPEYAISDKWQIKRAEPKIFTYVEIFQKLDEYRSTGVGEYSRCEVDEAIKMADKNGQNREYYRPEQVELRESIKRLYEDYYFHGSHKDVLHRAIKALENLKPPATN